jgi:hypothetical protein
MSHCYNPIFKGEFDANDNKSQIIEIKNDMNNINDGNCDLNTDNATNKANITPKRIATRPILKKHNNTLNIFKQREMKLRIALKKYNKTLKTLKSM